MAAVLACGDGGALSHDSAACLWGLWKRGERRSTSRSRAPATPDRAGVTVHRRHPEALADALTHNGIPVTSPLRTLVDLAARAERPRGRGSHQPSRQDGLSPRVAAPELDRLKGEPGAPLSAS